MKYRFFLDEDALNQENTAIWHTHYKPKPAHDHVADWQAYLEWYRQVVVEVLQIADETGWRGPDHLGKGGIYHARIVDRIICL